MTDGITNRFDRNEAVSESSGEASETKSDTASSGGAEVTVGSVIDGHYEVLALIGSGGMGTVYRARHIELDKIVALKLLDLSNNLASETILRFDREAKAASTLRHHGIAPVTNYGLTSRGQPYLVMDFVEGETLESYLVKNRRLSLEVLLPIISGIAEAMDYAHKKGVLHRDIKPSNIVVEEIENKVKPTVIDFGIARLIHENDRQGQSITKTGAVFGSPLYMSPEQGMGQKVDFRSDIYSLGCLMYECATGEAPFVGENSIQTIFKHLNDKPRAFKDIDKTLTSSKDLERVVSKCLAKRSDDRYQSMQSLLLDLKLLEEGKRPSAPRRSAMPKGGTLMLTCTVIGAIALGIMAMILQGPVLTMSAFQQYQSEAYNEWRQGPDHYARAEQAFEKAVSRIEPDHVPRGQAAELLYQMGLFYHVWSKTRESVVAYLKAKVIADSEPSLLEMQAKIRKDLMSELLQSGEYKMAVTEGVTALELFEKLNPKGSDSQAESAYAVGSAYYHQGQLDDAVRYYMKAYEIAQKLHPGKDSRIQAISAQQIASSLADLKRPDEAIQYGNEALEILRTTQGVSASETHNMATWLASFASEHARPDLVERVKREYSLK